MGSVHEIYGGKFLSVQTVLSGALFGRTLSVDGTYLHTMSEEDQELKVVLRIKDVERDLALNKTNALACAAAWGEDYENSSWVGKQFKLEIVKVMYKGNQVDGIKIVPLISE